MPLAAWEGANSRVPYFWVVEYTKRGWPHLHVILLWRDRITRDHLGAMRQLWEKYGMGISVDLRNHNWVRNNPLGLATYLAKYLGKSLWCTGRPGARRWSCSHGFLAPLERQRSEGRAGWSRAGVEVHRQERLAAGARIDDFSNGFRWGVGGISILMSPFTRALWEGLQRVHGGPPPRSHEYRYPGLDFSERLQLRPGRFAQLGDDTTLFIPGEAGSDRGVRP